MRRTIAFLTLALAGASQAAHYRFTPVPETSTGRVAIRLEKGAAKEFRMPAWAPGDYQIFNYGRFIESVEFKKNGKTVASEHSETDPNLWKIADGADEVTYSVRPSRGNFSPNLRVTVSQAFVSGPGVFGWFEGDQKNKQTLDIALQPAGAQAFSTLDPVAKPPADVASFTAFDYDEMIDAPFVVGTGIKSESFEVHGKPMKVVGFNRVANVDLASFVAVGKAAADSAHALFGELPFPRYTFYCDFGGGGGGLEHLNSTRLGLSANARGDGAVGFIFHEFFHLFNVKRIRPLGLGPFDYTKPIVLDTIWWLEGVTDYYAAILGYRSGLESRELFLRDMSGSLLSFSQNPNRLRISADESSRKVWETRGSNGFGGISYYEKGRLIGLVLDLAIRGQSKGEHSLDDVIRDLYQECKDRKPGYQETRIRELCLKYGGPALGAIYDACAKRAVELPINEVAAGVGLKWTGDELVPDPTANSFAKSLGASWPEPVKRRSLLAAVIGLN